MTLVDSPVLQRWLRPPELRTLSDAERRHATWLELFFDLVLVAVVGQLALGLSRNLTLTGMARYCGLFVPVAWAWMGFTFYANRFDTDDVVYRLLKALAMLGVVAMAILVLPAMSARQTAGFALAYVGVRIPLLVLYVRAARFANQLGRRISLLYASLFGFGVALWLLSALVAGPARYGLWACGLAVDFAAPPVAWRTLSRWAINASHITDRFGGFFIIVLGEGVLAVVTGSAGLHLDAATAVVGGASFAVALALWWIYFDLADTSVLGRGLMGLVFVYGHFPLLAGVAAVGAGVRVAVQHAAGGHLAPGIRWAVCGGVIAYLLSLALLHVGAEWTTLRDRAFLARLVLAGLAALLAGLGGALAPPLFMAIVAVGLLAQLALELVTYPTGATSAWTSEATVGQEPGGE